MQKFITPLALALFLLTGCADALQRGMLDQAYVSTARPSIMIKANSMPLMTSGQATANLFWSGMMGGLTIDLWMAVYGEGGLAPLAIVAQAQTPENWHWDGILVRPFSVDQGEEVFNGTTYQVCTFTIDPANDPFGDLVTGVKPDGQPQLWMVRAFAARYNFDQDKIILEYREPLPYGVTDLSALPLGQANLLAEFAQRAREAFAVSDAPLHPEGVREDSIQGVQMKYMGQRFLGTASQDASVFTFD